MTGVDVVLIGAGRWGRVHAGVLAGMAPRVGRVLWVARHSNPQIEGFGAHAPRFEVLESLDCALRAAPRAAIVATQSVQHAATTEVLLSNGVPTLVEKPLALNIADGERLVALAEQHALVLCVGLHLLQAGFLRHFRNLCSNRSIVSLQVEWVDPAFEMRHGELKACNFSAHKADDAVPHLWSIVTVLQPGYPPVLRAVRPQPRGAIALEMEVGPTRAVAYLARRGEHRKRRIDLAFADGGSGVLDFAEQPRITIDGVVREWTALEAAAPGPLAAEISGFLDAVGDPLVMKHNPQLAQHCLGSITLAEAVREKLVEEEAIAVADAVRAGAALDDPDVSAWIIDNLAPLLGEAGTRVLATDRGAQAGVVELARGVLSRMEPGSENNASPIREGGRFLGLVADRLSGAPQSDRRARVDQRKPEALR